MKTLDKKYEFRKHGEPGGNLSLEEKLPETLALSAFIQF